MRASSTVCSALARATAAPSFPHTMKPLFACLLLLAVHVESVMRTVSVLPLPCASHAAAPSPADRVLTRPTRSLRRPSVSFVTDVLPWRVQHPRRPNVPQVPTWQVFQPRDKSRAPRCRLSVLPHGAFLELEEHQMRPKLRGRHVSVRQALHGVLPGEIHDVATAASVAPARPVRLVPAWQVSGQQRQAVLLRLP